MATSRYHLLEMFCLFGLSLAPMPSACQNLLNACWELSPSPFSSAWPSICPPIFLSAVFPLFPLRSPSSTRPLIRAAELFNIRQWAWLLSQKEMKRRGGKAGETEKHGGVRYCGKSWVSRERKEQWEGGVKEFIDSFRWYDRREWRQMPPGAFVSVFVHARIDWAEKVMELRGD